MERSFASLGVVILLGVGLLASFGSRLAPHDISERFPDRLYAPPMLIRVVDANGRWRRPFVYPLISAGRTMRRFREDTTRALPLVWLSNGKLVRLADRSAGPLLLLGSDGLGRDVLARLASGARISLAVALAAAIGALVVGTAAGAVAGILGGLVDELIVKSADLVLLIPVMFVVLTLRASLPLVLPTSTLFGVLVVLLSLAGCPWFVKGVRGIVRSERGKDYVMAAGAVGVGKARLAFRYLLPATQGFLAVQATVLLPGFIVAETTLSFVGWGFVEPTVSWGTMLREAADIRVVTAFPWLLSPAIAVFAAVLGLNLVSGRQPLTPTL